MDEFIGEEVQVESEGEGDLGAFIWRGERFPVVKVLWRGKQLDFSRRWWQRRHMDKLVVRTAAGEEFELRRVKEKKGYVWRVYKRVTD